MSAVPDVVPLLPFRKNVPDARVILFPVVILRRGRILDVMGYCHANGCPNGDADGCHRCCNWEEINDASS